MYLCFNIWIEKGRWTWVEPKCSERRKMQSKKEVLTIEWMAHVQGHEVYQMRALSWWFSSGTTGRFLLWNNYFEQLKWLNEVEFLLQWIWFCSVTLSVVFFFTCFHLNDSSWMHLQDCIHPLFPLHQKKRLEYMFYICTGPIVRFVSIRFDFKTIKPSKHLQRISGSSFRKKFFIYISQNIRKWFVCKISRFVIDLVHSCIENCSFVLEVRLQW